MKNKLRVIADDPLYTVKEIADKLKVHEKTVRRMIDRSAIGHTMVGALIRIPESEYMAYIERNTHRSSG